METIAEKKIAQGALTLVRGDITLRRVDAIVNAANSHLQHGGGVAGAIVRRGGNSIQQESDRVGFTPVGTAAMTGAGSLPAKHVIHAVGPRMGEGDEDRKLTSAVIHALRLAAEKELRSISFPAISSGIFGFPKDQCAKILVSCAKDFLLSNPASTVREIEFCIYDAETLKHFKREFELL